MKDHLKIFLAALLPLAWVGCSDDDSFTTSPSATLAFSVDTLRLDTIFSNVPSAAKSLWVFNRSSDGVRCSSVRLGRGGVSGFRVNVDGIYLGPETRYATDEIEIRKGDSVRVYVELTSPVNHAEAPQLDEDDLIFTLESGVEQRVNLNAWTWDARFMRNVVIDRDSVIDGAGRPLIIYGGIRVDSAATLTLAPGTTLYFHADCGVDVYGRLLAMGEAGREVTLRGDRIDRMFDYLPYDRTPGQWQGLRFRPSSYGNELCHTDLHSGTYGIIADSSDVERQKLTLMASTVHNFQGDGVRLTNCKATIENSQLTNNLGDCLRVEGGDVDVNGCTLAQFYPFDSNRGFAIAFSSSSSSSYPLDSLTVLNTLITGYGDDLLMGEKTDSATTFNYRFDHCVIRTPRLATSDSTRFTSVIFEDVEDTTRYGTKHFRTIDTDNLVYDFRLDSLSPAVGAADAATSLPTDRLGNSRDGRPDIGAYEYVGEALDPSAATTRRRWARRR